MEQQAKEDGRPGKLTRAVGNIDTAVVGSPRNYTDMSRSWYTILGCSNIRLPVITDEEEGTASARKIGIPDDFPPNECIFTRAPYFSGYNTAILVIGTWRRTSFIHCLQINWGSENLKDKNHKVTEKEGFNSSCLIYNKNLYCSTYYYLYINNYFKSSVFWDVTQRRLIASDVWRQPLKMGPICFFSSKSR